MYRKTAIILSLVLCLSISGCYDKLEVGDTIVVVAHGWDIEGDERILSAQLALTPPREGQLETGPKYLVVSERSPTNAQSARDLSLSLPRKPLWSMANTIVMGENLARRDIGLIVDTAMRNPRVRLNVLMFVSKDSTPEEIFKVEVPPEKYSGTALEKMIEGQLKQAGLYMPVDMKSFLFRSATEGIEPVIPQIAIIEEAGKKKLALQGTAVFKGRKMVGSLNEQESQGLSLLESGAIKKATFNVKNPSSSNEDEEIELSEILALELTAYKTWVKPVINGNNITIKIEMEAEGNIIEENSTGEIAAPKTVEVIEGEAAQALKMNIQACIDQAQTLDSDILGWGLSISRSFPETWSEINDSWTQIFSGVKSEISVKFKLRKSYLQKDTFKFK